jgi:hypothetical protein
MPPSAGPHQVARPVADRREQPHGGVARLHGRAISAGVFPPCGRIDEGDASGRSLTAWNATLAHRTWSPVEKSEKKGAKAVRPFADTSNSRKTSRADRDSRAPTLRGTSHSGPGRWRAASGAAALFGESAGFRNRVAVTSAVCNDPRRCGNARQGTWLEERR